MLLNPPLKGISPGNQGACLAPALACQDAFLPNQTTLASLRRQSLAKHSCLPQAGLAETQLLCREYSWLGQIYQYVHSWSDSQLESMKGWPAEEYVNQVLKLRTWAVQVQKVPHVVITFNRFFLVDCGGILQEIRTCFLGWGVGKGPSCCHHP